MPLWGNACTIIYRRTVSLESFRSAVYSLRSMMSGFLFVKQQTKAPIVFRIPIQRDDPSKMQVNLRSDKDTEPSTSGMLSLFDTYTTWPIDGEGRRCACA